MKLKRLLKQKTIYRNRNKKLITEKLKAMKTNFKNIIAISTVAFAGVFSVNATENNLKLSTESTTVDYRTEAQLITRWIADMAEAKATQRAMERSFVTPVEAFSSYTEARNTFEAADFLTEAQLMTRETADREEAKVTQKIMNRVSISPEKTISFTENESEMTDYRLEAQLITKEIADRAEAKAIQKVMHNELTEENLEEIDFRAEAQLEIRLIADKEEVKALQKLASEGRIAETK